MQVQIDQQLWPSVSGLETVASPGLLIDENRVISNIGCMVDCVGGDTARLRPHVKTHKMPRVIALQVEAGIRKFKAATTAEAEMVAEAGGTDILLAYQPVGPNVKRLVDLTKNFHDVSFATVADDKSVVDALGQAAVKADTTLRVFIDVDCGMHRTGISLGPLLDELRDHIEASPALQFAGLHVYDGHLHQPALSQRQAGAEHIIDAVRAYDSARPSPTIVGGGSPTFPIWADKSDWECSPGTPVFWDVGYNSNYPDLPFRIAAAIVTRVISKPSPELICLDIGYKSIASEMPLERRVIIPDIQDARWIGHSEEHLVVETSLASKISIGQSFLAYPRHVCPTVALYASATVVRDGAVTHDVWRVTARDR